MSEPLPWDLYKPDEPVPEPVPPQIPSLPIPPGPPPDPEPELPYIPPGAVTPVPPGDLDALLAQAWPAVKDLLGDYAREAWGGIKAGQTVDVLHPTITATDVSGRELVVADARNRSWRTFVQGLIFDLLAGLVAAIAVLSGLDPFSGETWIAFGVLVLKTFVSAGISYVMRLKATPTIRTRGPEIALMPLPRPVLDDDELDRAREERLHA